jgi:hypothetical protein
MRAVTARVDARVALLGLLAILVAPLVVAAVALHRPQWSPVLDLAMTELRLRDVFTSHTPLIGLPGRIGRFPDQGSHPGPMSFYALWPTWKVLGSSAWGMQVGAIVLNAVASIGAVLVARRRGGLRLAVGITAVLLVLMLGYGLDTLVQPWNPYIPLLWWFLALLALWSVLCGDLVLAPVAVVAASMAAQTHVPYLGLCIGVCGFVAAWLVVTAVREPDRRRAIVRWGAIAAAVTALLWSPVVIDQLVNDPGNLTMLKNHFTHPPEEDGPPIGIGEGIELALRHLDVTGFIGDGGSSLGSLAQSSGGQPGGSVAGGAIVLAVWIGAAAVAWRRRQQVLLRLHALVGVALLLGVYSMSRIFGKVWYYLMLWAWGTLALACVAIVWTVLDALDDERARRAVVGAGVAVAVVTSALLVHTAAGLDPPAPQLSAALAATVPVAARSLEHDKRYLVTWDDGFYIGSQGYGVVNDLERLGFHVGVPDTWRVPVTKHRVYSVGDVDAEVKLAVGVYVERWRRSGAKELAFDDPRDAAQRAEYDRLHAKVADALARDGLDDLVPLLDGNLFGASLDPRIDDGEREAMEQMLELGSPAAIFLVRPGTTLPPP